MILQRVYGSEVFYICVILLALHFCREDAKKAKDGNINIEGRKVVIDYADKSKKISRPPKKIKEEVTEEEPPDISNVIEDNKDEVESKEHIGEIHGM